MYGMMYGYGAHAQSFMQEQPPLAPPYQYWHPHGAHVQPHFHTQRSSGQLPLALSRLPPSPPRLTATASRSEPGTPPARSNHSAGHQARLGSAVEEPPSKRQRHETEYQTPYDCETPSSTASKDPKSPDFFASSLATAALASELEDVVREMTPTIDDLEKRRQLVNVVRTATARTFPGRQLQVKPFGSFSSGLCTKSSDVDVVIVGLVEPDPQLGFYPKSRRPAVAGCLDMLANTLRSMLPIAKLLIIRHARIPILRIDTVHGVSIDISFCNDSGPEAAEFIKVFADQFVVLRPLVWILKRFLKGRKLQDVKDGGLSSYGLTHMVIAHLQKQLKLKCDINNKGLMLLRFFQQYGKKFHLQRQVVALKNGGIVPRDSIDHPYESRDKLSVLDPLTGRDITAGTYLIKEVQAAFCEAAKQLEVELIHFDTCGTKEPFLRAMLDNLSTTTSKDDDDDDEDYLTMDLPQGGGRHSKAKRKLPR